jgi:hypothetical protein
VNVFMARGFVLSSEIQPDTERGLNAYWHLMELAESDNAQPAYYIGHNYKQTTG